jgi:hypothetical protein
MFEEVRLFVAGLGLSDRDGRVSGRRAHLGLLIRREMAVLPRIALRLPLREELRTGDQLLGGRHHDVLLASTDDEQRAEG